MAMWRRNHGFFARLGLAALLAVLAIGAPAVAAPGASDWVAGEKGRVRLVSSVTQIGDLEAVRLGLEVELADGWKTYWRSPGDAGLPPSIDWSGSDNLAATALHYPAPSRFAYEELETYGYKGRVVYPIEAVLGTPGTALTLAADVNLLICDDVCIPHNMKLAMALPGGDGGATASEFVNLIDRFAARVPGDGSDTGLAFEDAVLSGTPEAPILRAAFSADDPFVAPDMLVEGPDFVTFSRPKIEHSADGRQVLVTITAADSFGDRRDLELTSMPLTLTLMDGERVMETTTAPQFGAVPGFDPAAFGAAGAATGLSFIAILGLALIGGLILNLMPCVLPVLSIKLLSVVGHGGDDPKHVRIGFLATTAGIVGAFLVLALILVGLKLGGMAVGWGIQFQHPAFIVTMILILVLFAANMWGLYEVRLPGAVADAAMMGSAASDGRTGLKGHFFQGAFATVLATPCSAPFLGTAVGFALSRGPVEILSVFAALGIGMALPFLAVAAFPKLATKLPRPGNWMLTLKKGMALALIATAVWLISVLAIQVSDLAAMIVAGLMVATLVFIGVRTRLPEGLARVVPLAVLALALGAYATPAAVPERTFVHGPEMRGNVQWVPFDRMAIPELVAAGRIVFVDVTAEWCITCQVNKRRVLDTAAIADIMAGDQIVAMKADWTQPSDEIAAYLASFNRFGIPFNVVYGAQAPRGVVLPELLTRRAVMAALDTAGAELQSVAEY